MTESKRASILDPDDDAPDLSTPEWQAKFAGAPVRRGRPKLEETKVSTTIRLDRDVLDHFRSGGEGWQTRINDALRAAMRARRQTAPRPSKARA